MEFQVHTPEKVQVLEHKEEDDGKRYHFQANVYQVPVRDEPFAMYITAGNVYNVALNGESTRKGDLTYKEVLSQIEESGIARGDAARSLAAFVVELARRTNKPVAAILENLQSYWSASENDHMFGLRLSPGIWGSLRAGVTNDQAKKLLGDKGLVSWPGFDGITIRRDEMGNPYYVYKGKVIDGDGLIVGIKDGDVVVIDLENPNKTYDIYKHFKELELKGYKVYYLYVGEVRENEKGLRVELLDRNYSGSAIYYGESVIENKWIRKGNDIRLLQIRTLNVGGYFQQQYRMISLEDLKSATTNDFRWGDKKTTMWMRFTEASVKKRAAEGWLDELGENAFASLKTDPVYRFGKGFVHTELYDYRGELIEAHPPVKAGEHVAFLLPPMVMTLPKPIEQPKPEVKKEEPEYQKKPVTYSVSVSGPEYRILGTTATYSLQTTHPEYDPNTEYLPEVDHYLSFALVAREGSLWVAVPGREAYVYGKNYPLEDQYLGKYMGDSIRVYFEGNKIVGYETLKWMDVPIDPMYRDTFFRDSKLAGKAFISPAPYVQYRIDGPTTVYGMVVPKEGEPSNLAAAETQAVERIYQVERLPRAPLDKPVKLPSMTLEYEVAGSTLEVSPDGRYYPYFKTVSGTRYLINKGVVEIGGYKVGEDVFALGRLEKDGIHIKVKDGVVVDAYKGQGKEVVIPLEEINYQPEIIQRNGEYTFNAGQVVVPYAEKSFIASVGVEYVANVKVGDQEDSFVAVGEREVYMPKEEVAPPKPEVKMERKPEVVPIKATVYAPAVILIGSNDPYPVRVETSEEADSTVLFGVLPTTNAQYLYITAPREGTYVINGVELRLGKDVKNLGVIRNGKLYIYHEDGRIVDASIGATNVVEVNIGSPQEWYANLGPLAELFVSKDGIYKVLPSAGTRALWYGGAIKDGKLAGPLALDESKYGYLQGEATSQVFRVASERAEAREAELTLFFEIDGEKVKVDRASVRVLPIFRSPALGEYQLVLNKEAKATALYVPGKGYLVFDNPLEIKDNLSLFRELGERARPSDFVSEEEFLSNPGVWYEAKVEGDRAIFDISGEIPVPGTLHYRWSVRASPEGYERSVEGMFESIHRYVREALTAPAEEISPAWEARSRGFEQDDLALNVLTDIDQIYNRNRRYLDISGNEEMLRKALTFWPYLVLYQKVEEAGLSDKATNINARMKDAFGAILSLPLVRTLEFNPDIIEPLAYVLIGETNLGADNYTYPAPALTIGELIAMVDVDSALEWIRNNRDQLFSGNAPENVKNFVLLAVLFNVDLNNDIYVDNVDAFVNVLENFGEFLRILKDFSRDYDAGRFFSALQDWKAGSYYSVAGNESLVKVLFDNLANIDVSGGIYTLRITEIDLVRLGVDWTVWERADEQTRARILTKVTSTFFYRETAQQGLGVEVVKDDQGNPVDIMFREEQSTAKGFGAKVSAGMGYEYQDRLQNLRIEVEVGGKLYVIEQKDNQGWKVPEKILEEARVQGGAIYTREVYESNDVRVEVFTKVEGSYTRDFLENKDLVLVTGRVGVVLGWDMDEQGQPRYRIKAAYQLNYDGTWSQRWDVTGYAEVGPGELRLGIVGAPGELVRELRAGYAFHLGENTTLDLGVSRDLSTGDTKASLELRFKF